MFKRVIMHTRKSKHNTECPRTFTGAVELQFLADIGAKMPQRDLECKWTNVYAELPIPI